MNFPLTILPNVPNTTPARVIPVLSSRILPRSLSLRPPLLASKQPEHDPSNRPADQGNQKGGGGEGFKENGGSCMQQGEVKEGWNEGEGEKIWKVIEGGS
jgi:hypothetical protein